MRNLNDYIIKHFPVLWLTGAHLLIPLTLVIAVLLNIIIVSLPIVTSMEVLKDWLLGFYAVWTVGIVFWQFFRYKREMPLGMSCLYYFSQIGIHVIILVMVLSPVHTFREKVQTTPIATIRNELIEYQAYIYAKTLNDSLDLPSLLSPEDVALLVLWEKYYNPFLWADTNRTASYPPSSYPESLLNGFNNNSLPGNAWTLATRAQPQRQKYSDLDGLDYGFDMETAPAPIEWPEFANMIELEENQEWRKDSLVWDWFQTRQSINIALQTGKTELPELRNKVEGFRDKYQLPDPDTVAYYLGEYFKRFYQPDYNEYSSNIYYHIAAASGPFSMIEENYHYNYSTIVRYAIWTMGIVVMLGLVFSMAKVRVRALGAIFLAVLIVGSMIMAADLISFSILDATGVIVITAIYIVFFVITFIMKWTNWIIQLLIQTLHFATIALFAPVTNLEGLPGMLGCIGYLLLSLVFIVIYHKHYRIPEKIA